MNIRIRYFLSGLIYLLLAFPGAARAQETPLSSPDTYFSSAVSSTDRFEIVMIPFEEQKIFRFDRVCGITEFLVLNDRKAWVWQTMRAPDLFPCMNDGRNHYQFFATGKDDHVFLMHTDTKVAWRLDLQRMIWLHM